MAPAIRDPAQSNQVRTRRRGNALRAAIFEAALDQLRTVGYVNLTMEVIATAAGTGKAALYRRWADKEALVTDALRNALPDPAAVPLGGGPREDILALLRCMRDTIAISQDSTFQVVKREAGHGLGQRHTVVQECVMGPCRDRILDVLRRGVRTGRVLPAAATGRIADVGMAMLVHHAITAGPEISDEYLRSVVDDVIMPLIAPPEDRSGQTSR